MASATSCLPSSSRAPQQREKPFLRREKTSRSFRAQTARSCRLATERRRSHSRGSLRIVSGLAENTNSIFGDGSAELETANGCLVLQQRRNHPPRGIRAQQKIPIDRVHALQSAPSDLAFSLDNRLTWTAVTRSASLIGSWSRTILPVFWAFEVVQILRMSALANPACCFFESSNREGCSRSPRLRPLLTT